jgi:hypothetical protein
MSCHCEYSVTFDCVYHTKEGFGIIRRRAWQLHGASLAHGPVLIVCGHLQSLFHRFMRLAAPQ